MRQLLTVATIMLFTLGMVSTQAWSESTPVNHNSTDSKVIVVAQSAFGVSNLGSDNYGEYDNDFNEEVDNNAFRKDYDSDYDSWYGDSDKDWNAYDDSRDDGWLDW